MKSQIRKPYRKTSEYHFSECGFGEVEFTVVDRDGETRNIHFKSGKMYQSGYKGNIQKAARIREFTNWIAECIESTINEHSKGNE